MTDKELATPRFANECTRTYLDAVRDFIHDGVAHKVAENRKSRGMFEAFEREGEWDADTDLSMGATRRLGFLTGNSSFLMPFLDAEVAIVDNKAKVTEAQLRRFLHVCWVKYVKARIEPGLFDSTTLPTAFSKNLPRFHCGRRRCPIDWRTGHSDDFENFPFCWRCINECDPRRTAYQGNHQCSESDQHTDHQLQTRDP